MIPDHNDKLTKQLLRDSTPEWNNPGFTETVMRQIVAAEQRETRRRRFLIPSVIFIAIGLTAYSFVNLLKTKPTTFSTQAHALGELGAWITGKEYILLPLVLLLLAKRVIDSRHTHTHETR